MKTAAVIWLLASSALSACGGDSSTSMTSVGTTTNIAPPVQLAAVTAPVNGTIGFSGASFPVDQSAGSVIITVVRMTAAKGAMSVTYSTLNGSAIAGTNYTASTGTLEWADGDGSSKTFIVPLNSSDLFTGTKTFVVQLVAGANTILGSPTTATVSIAGGTGFVSFDDNLPAAGSQGTDAIPSGGGLEDTSHPNHVIGNGTPSSCTSAAVVTAVKAGGVITFDCGSAPVTIQMANTAQIFNNAASNTVIDGGGLVTLSGMTERRILYMNTCDQTLVWTTPHCDNQQYPQLTVQNLTFINGNAGNELVPEGGAIYARGGRVKVVNSRFFNNACASTGPDTAGGAIYSTEQYQGLPLFVVHSTFGGESNLSNICSNGGALGSIGVTWSVINSLLTYNHAVGNGGNPAASGTPGGGSGGAIYNDGDTMTLTVSGSTLNYNEVNAYGSGIFFVSDNLTGNIVITDSTIMGNIGGSWYPKYPQISAEPSTPITVKNSVIVN
ncbi:MAG: Calx-beta domain-containing protein [Steroidobacteraceae bacterium]